MPSCPFKCSYFHMWLFIDNGISHEYQPGSLLRQAYFLEHVPTLSAAFH